MKCTNCGEDEEMLRVIGDDRLCMGCVVGEVMKLRKVVSDIRADIRSRFVAPSWNIKHVGDVSHCTLCGGNGEEDGEPEHTASCTLSIGVER